jgi:hypothetical protein
MAGGVIQLVAVGKEDLFITNDPQITFFKVIYRRHTNFAREDIPQFFINEPDFGKRSTCLISQTGDLVNNMALKITLPEIPCFSSQHDGKARDDCTENKMKFAWIRRIGFAMIKFVEVEIDGKVIDRHYGEWLHIWSCLTTRNITDNGLNKLIGDVPELTDFTFSKDEYVLFIPLQFWFCRSPGLSLPVINLQYSDIKVNLELYDLDKCYVISPSHSIKCDANLENFKQYEYLVQKGCDGIDRYGIFSHFDAVNKRLYYTAITHDKFTGMQTEGDVSIQHNSKSSYNGSSTAGLNALLNRINGNKKGNIFNKKIINKNVYDDSISRTDSNPHRFEKYVIRGVTSGFTIVPEINSKTMTVHHRSLKNIKLKECIILANYIYVDNEERFKFAKRKNDYLIEQLYYTPNVPIEGPNAKVQLVADQPCKLTVWVAQLDYIYDFNDRFNYTDSHIIKCQYNVPTEVMGPYNSAKYIGNSLIEESTIKLNSQDRLTKRPNKYFEYLQPFQHTLNRLPEGCGMYSYGLIPTQVAPSGTTNMSQIELVELHLKMNHKISVNQKAKFRSYSLCYNVWRVDSGLSGLVFIKN